MNYRRLTNEQLGNFPYPNLIAEIIESGYGFHTISDFMGHGNTYETQDMIMAKLKGEDSILASEAFGLAKYYNVKFKYLFSHELSVVEGKPEAYWRWYDTNKRKREEYERNQELNKIQAELKRRTSLVDLMKLVINMSDEDLCSVTGYISSMGVKIA